MSTCYRSKDFELFKYFPKYCQKRSILDKTSQDNRSITFNTFSISLWKIPDFIHEREIKCSGLYNGLSQSCIMQILIWSLTSAFLGRNLLTAVEISPLE